MHAIYWAGYSSATAAGLRRIEAVSFVHPARVPQMAARRGGHGGGAAAGRRALQRPGAEPPLRCHFHNTRNTGYANALAAIEAGVTALDASSGGIGGCPFAPAATGNIATEDLLYALGRSGIGTGIDMAALLAASASVLPSGLMRPIWPAPISANHTAPPAAWMPTGAASAVGSGAAGQHHGAALPGIQADPADLPVRVDSGEFAAPGQAGPHRTVGGQGDAVGAGSDVVFGHEHCVLLSSEPP